MATIEQARLVPRSLRLSLLARLEPAGSRVLILNGTLGFPMSDHRNQLRQLIRQRRRLLSQEQQNQAAHNLVDQCMQQAFFQASQHIAIYLSTDGELNTQPLIDALWNAGKSIYLPVLHPFSQGHLLFLHYQKETPMTLNKFGIREPKLDQRLIIPATELDIICTPLVAFDSTCQRLGMGGGYYDRTLAPWFQTKVGATPIGLAHDCQHVDAIPTEAWDVPLPSIITPSQLFTAK